MANSAESGQTSQIAISYLDLHYSRTSMAQTLMARIPFLTRTRSWVPMVPYMRLLLSNFCIYGVVLLFYFSIFSGRRSLKIENENNSTKSPRYRGLVSLEFRII